MITTADHLSGLLADLDDANCECNGLTRLVTTTLHWHQIPHSVFKGEVRRKRTDGGPDLVVAPHYWARVGDLVIDYRARMWLGTDVDVPHGVFMAAEFPAVEYAGVEVDLMPLPATLFRFVFNNDGLDFEKLMPGLSAASNTEHGTAGSDGYWFDRP
jgi:hypothetical protein|tara:strand:+ start:7796 stop:8266 length:471 start_codon:yes stop_codon:yes gene_type:complete